mmetsp:Transcript_44575/g.140679  ORF Transcript_44575/g.140679 Transcript_44575/m.140679 type:complete len:107 (-) Transcript_44575:426-746(-)
MRPILIADRLTLFSEREWILQECLPFFFGEKSDLSWHLEKWRENSSWLYDHRAVCILNSFDQERRNFDLAVLNVCKEGLSEESERAQAEASDGGFYQDHCLLEKSL